jgi:hypothetical protein
MGQVLSPRGAGGEGDMTERVVIPAEPGFYVVMPVPPDSENPEWLFDKVPVVAWEMPARRKMRKATVLSTRNPSHSPPRLQPECLFPAVLPRWTCHRGMEALSQPDKVRASCKSLRSLTKLMNSYYRLITERRKSASGCRAIPCRALAEAPNGSRRK